MSKLPHFLDFFRDIVKSPTFILVMYQKRNFRHDSTRCRSYGLNFFAESVKRPTSASYAGNKKTMIVITIAFVSEIQAVHMPESLNAEMSHAYHAQGSLISVVCRSSDLSIHLQRIFPSHKRIASAFSRSHDSSSNDRFSPHADCSAWKTIL